MKVKCLLEFTNKQTRWTNWFWHSFPKSWIHVHEIYRPQIWKYDNGLLPHFGGYGHDLPTGYVKLPNGSRLKIITVDPDEAKKAHLNIHKIFRLFPTSIGIKS